MRMILFEPTGVLQLLYVASSAVLLFVVHCMVTRSGARVCLATLDTHILFIQSDTGRNETTMAGLSSNVMNMKFMQKAQKKAEDLKKDNQVKKVKDTSEWVLPNRSIVQQKIKPAVLVQTVGYGSIANLMTKKNDEEETKSEKSDKEETEASLKVRTTTHDVIHLILTNIQDPKKEAEKFLNSIMSKSKKRSKTRDDTKKTKKPKRH